MNQARGQQSARVNVDGKEVNISIEMDTGSAAKPMHLSGAENLPEGVAQAKTSKEMQQNALAHDSESFANPEHVVRQVGFTEGMQIADLGAGSGAYALSLAKLVGPSGVVYAVDVQKELLTRIQNNATHQGYKNVEIVWADMESPDGVGIRDALLDGVVISNSLFQVDDKITTVKEAWRVLKPGGILLIVDWEDSFGGLGPQQSEIVTQAQTMVLCTDNNFAFKKEVNAGKHHYGLVFLKMIEGESVEEVLSRSHTTEEDFIQKTIDQELI